MMASAVSFTAMSALSHGLADRVHWTVVTVARTLVAVVFASILAHAGGVPVLLIRPPVLWLRSIFGSLSMLTTFYALSCENLPVGTAVTLFNLQPLWILVLCAIVYRQPIRWTDVIALISGILGTVLVLRPHFGDEVWGSISAIASSFFASVAMMGLNRLGKLDARSVVVHFSMLSSVVAVGAWLALEGSTSEMRTLPGATLAMLLFVGLSGMLGQLMLTKAYGGGRAPTVAMAGMSQIAFGAIVDYLVFRHTLDGWTLAGMALILLPCLWELSHPMRKPTGAAATAENFE